MRPTIVLLGAAALTCVSTPDMSAASSSAACRSHPAAQLVLGVVDWCVLLAVSSFLPLGGSWSTPTYASKLACRKLLVAPIPFVHSPKGAIDTDQNYCNVIPHASPAGQVFR